MWSITPISDLWFSSWPLMEQFLEQLSKIFVCLHPRPGTLGFSFLPQLVICCHFNIFGGGQKAIVPRGGHIDPKYWYYRSQIVISFGLKIDWYFSFSSVLVWTVSVLSKSSQQGHQTHCFHLSVEQAPITLSSPHNRLIYRILFFWIEVSQLSTSIFV